MLSIPLRLLKEKLLLYHHVSTLPEESLARRILETQEELHFPSLRNEVVNFLTKYETHDVKSFSKEKWRDYVRVKIIEMDREALEKEMYKYKKIDATSLSLEEYGIKSYFKELSLEDSRIKFRERSSTMTSCR